MLLDKQVAEDRDKSISSLSMTAGFRARLAETRPLEFVEEKVENFETKVVPIMFMKSSNAEYCKLQSGYFEFQKYADHVQVVSTFRIRRDVYNQADWNKVSATDLLTIAEDFDFDEEFQRRLYVQSQDFWKTPRR